MLCVVIFLGLLVIAFLPSEPSLSGQTTMSLEALILSVAFENKKFTTRVSVENKIKIFNIFFTSFKERQKTSINLLGAVHWSRLIAV